MQRGTEVPTAYTVWMGLFLLSATIKREAWIGWESPESPRLYANVYTILLGPPGMKKSVDVVLAHKILRDYNSYIADRNLRQIKKAHIMIDRFTPEALMKNMEAKGVITFRDDEGNAMIGRDGRILTYPRTSEIAIMVPELAATFDKKQYNQGIIPMMLELYECKDSMEKSLVEQTFFMRNLHTSFIGASTPDAFTNMLPRDILSDGFMSRVAVVLQTDTEREFRMPRRIKNAPNREDIKMRLAWLTERIQGEYHLSKAADEHFYKDWYHRFHIERRQDPAIRGIKARLDIMLLKVAFLLHAQRYDAVDHEIEEEDLEDADMILRGTFSTTPQLISDLKDPDYFAPIRRVEEYIKAKRSINRLNIIKNTHLNAKVLTVALNHLLQEAKIVIEGDEKRFTARQTSSETYRYVGEEEEA